jgi:hypothetical protein
MDTPSENAWRDAFFWKVAEQFEGLARWVAGPLKAEAWEDGREAVFSVRQDDFELLRFSASFDDEGARQKRLNQKLNLVGEWKGEASDLLVLGWKESVPDLDKGLDSRADYAEGEYAGAMGKVVELLRDKLDEALKPQPVSVSRALARTAQREQVPVVDMSFEPVRSVPRAERVPERKDERGSGAASSSTGDRAMSFLAISLGVLGKMPGMGPEEVFAGFIAAAREMSLRERQVEVYAQSALLHLYLVEKQLFEGPTWSRPRIREDALIVALAKEKSDIFRGSRIGQKQRADQIVAAMENYYRIVLSVGGLKSEEVDNRVRTAFGRTKLIVTTAVDGLRSSVQPKRAWFERIFQRRHGLE